MLARRTALAAALILAPAVPTFAGEILTPLALPNVSDLTVSGDDLRQGYLVPPEKVITDQFAARGVVFDRVAVGDFGGTPGWVPVGNWPLPPLPVPDSIPDTLNFFHAAAAIRGHFVVPGTDIPAQVSWLNAGFRGVGSAGDFLWAAMLLTDRDGKVVANPVMMGPVSGLVLHSPRGLNITGFTLYAGSNASPDWENPYPWGVVSLEFDTPTALPATATTPEPATFVLAGLGLLGLAARRRPRG